MEVVQIWARKEGIRGYQRDKWRGQHGGTYTEMCAGKTGVSLPHFLTGESLKRSDRACLHLDLDV